MVAVTEMLTDIINSQDIPPHFQIEIQEELPIFMTQFIPLQQVFNNLISDAIKHSDCESGKIVIFAVEHDDYYEFAVADTGKGINPQDRERIFNIFQTLEARDSKENTGIGLSIAQKAVENQEGVIKVKSQLGVGSTFSFTWKK